MLILTRRVGERIIINKNIVVCVMGLRNDIVRLGVEAPPEIEIDREEIHLAKEMDEEDV